MKKKGGVILLYTVAGCHLPFMHHALFVFRHGDNFSQQFINSPLLDFSPRVSPSPLLAYLHFSPSPRAALFFLPGVSRRRRK